VRSNNTISVVNGLRNGETGITWTTSAVAVAPVMERAKNRLWKLMEENRKAFVRKLKSEVVWSLGIRGLTKFFNKIKWKGKCRRNGGK